LEEKATKYATKVTDFTFGVSFLQLMVYYLLIQHSNNKCFKKCKDWSCLFVKKGTRKVAFNFLGALAIMVATIASTWPCLFMSYQPKEPAALDKFNKD